MAIQLSPGVQVVEKDFTQIIPSLATTRGAYAGKFKWGPVLEPTLITSENELVSKFRKPDENTYLSFFTAANFLAYSNNMLVTRINTGDSRNAVALPSGPVTSVTMVEGGSGYRMVPTVAFSDPAVADGIPATGVAVLSGGLLPTEGVVINDGGTDYESGDVITLSAPDVKVLDNGTGLYSFVQATAVVDTVDENGTITAITITDPGDGYIENATVLSIDSADGVGASISITPVASSVASVKITNGGSGYTADQEIDVIIVANELDDGDGAVGSAYATVTGTKILNSTHYTTSFANGQGSKGEWAGKYPGDLGNSLLVSMCDAANWQSDATGSIYARKDLEDVEDSREKVIGRVFGTDLETLQDQLDIGKVVRTSTTGAQKRLGEILELDTAYKYRKIKFVAYVPSLEYQSIDLSQSQATEYTGSGVISATTLTTTVTGLVSTVGLEAGMVLDKTAGTGDFGGRTVIVSVDSPTEITIKSTSANTTGSVTFEANSNNTTTRALGNREIVVGDKNIGFMDGYYKVYDEANAQYVLSAQEMLVRLTDASNTSLHGDIAVGDIVKNGTGDVHGIVESVEEYFVVQFNDVNDNEILGEQFRTEWKYKSQFNSAPGTSAYASARGSSNDELHVIVIDEDGKISGTGAVLEKFANVSKASDARNSAGRNNYYKDVINSSSRWVWWTDHPVANINAGMGGTPNWGADADGAVTYHSLTNAVSRSLDGGADSVSASSGNYTEAYTLYADDEVYDISLIPLGDAPASVATWVIQNVAEKRKDCVVFVSGPKLIGTSSSIATEIVKYRDQLPSSSYAVMDSTWKYQYDRYNDKYRWVPMNGDTAGICARTDELADPWFSPGGYSRGVIKNVIKVAYNPNKAQRDVLYQAGVNPIVTFPGQGTVLFGDKTMQRMASAFDRINVRRLFIVLEKAISTASKFQLFEFNDPFTRAQFRNIVEPFLRDVQGRRGIVDFRVRCDESNNTPEIIDTNQFVADIFIKPNRSINYITLNFIAAKTGASFEELGV